ncbi:hypothetical protein B7486_63235, partial [cyanobacterium TDX16]
MSDAPEPVHEHAHSHHLGRDRGPLDGPLRVVLPALVGALVVATAIGLVALWPDDREVEEVFTDGGTFQVQFVDGTVRSVEDGPCPGTDPSAGATCTLLEVEVTSGPTAAGDGEEPTIATIQQVPT